MGTSPSNSTRYTSTVVGRSEASELLTWEDVTQVVREVYEALATREAILFPLVREDVPGGWFGLRSGMWQKRGLLGSKVSGFFLGNRRIGLDSHQSCIVLLNPGTGQVDAIVDGN